MHSDIPIPVLPRRLNQLPFIPLGLHRRLPQQLPPVVCIASLVQWQENLLSLMLAR